MTAAFSRLCLWRYTATGSSYSAVRMTSIGATGTIEQELNLRTCCLSYVESDGKVKLKLVMTYVPTSVECHLSVCLTCLYMLFMTYAPTNVLCHLTQMLDVPEHMW